MNYRRTALASALAVSVFALAACGGSGDGSGSTPVPVGDTIVLTESGRLLSFNRTTPGTQVGAVSISGLTAGETLLGIDFRPANGKLYGVGSTGGVYELDAATGIATLASRLGAATGDDNPFTALAGTSFAIDFNPVADRLRLISNTGQNLRINVETGAAITDGNLNPAGSSVTAAAYTNSFAGTGTTQLFDLDVAAGRLLLQDPPNNGTVNAGVPLGVTADAANGFDIDARNNAGYAALRVGSETALYSINLGATANAATRIGTIAGGESVRGLALAQAAAPTALALTADNRLAAFNPAAPSSLLGTVTITGLGAGEAIVGIDFRPKDGLLYGVATGGKLYTIDPATGAATFRANLSADAADTTAPYSGLSGSKFSVDFNPVADRLRVISDTGLNLRIAVETVTANGVTVTAGQTTTDGTINRADIAPSVVAAAYSNSFAGTASTSLFDLDAVSDQLALQSPPNNGTLVNIGALGLDISQAAALDIAGGDNGLVLAALRAGPVGPFTLYTVSLTSGAASLYRNTTGNAALSLIGGLAGPGNVIDLAIRF